jgi:hypothetical protein
VSLTSSERLLMGRGHCVRVLPSDDDGVAMERGHPVREGLMGRAQSERVRVGMGCQHRVSGC